MGLLHLVKFLVCRLSLTQFSVSHALANCLENGVFLAWYDSELKSYQNDRMDSELERVLEERIDADRSILHKSQFGDYMAKPINTTETEWQKVAREKNAGAKIKSVSFNMFVEP